MTEHPSITVIMPVFNAIKYVNEAIQSILDQSYPDFEFIIINDGSTDESLEVIKSFNDKRINILNNPSNIGNYPSRNKGINIAKGKYVCVMDADDIAFPTRFERQFKFMEENSEIGLAGSGFRYYGREDDIFREFDYEKIKVILMRNNCFIHPTLIMRHKLLKKYNLRYDEKYYYASDYDFILRAARFFPITNISEILLYYRTHEDQITTKNRQKQSEYAKEIAINQLRYLGIEPNQDELTLYTKLLKGTQIEYPQKDALEKWKAKILKVNLVNRYYDEDELESFLISLLSMQSFCYEASNIRLKTKLSKIDIRYDLVDVTFLIRLRIDSQQRIENTETVVKFITRFFKAVISIYEVDSEQRYFPKKLTKNVRYQFIEDSNEIFPKTGWANQMISIVDTSYVAIWDSDVICSPEQVIEAVDNLRIGEVVMSYPYDGRLYLCDNMVSNLFKRTDQIDVLKKQIPVMKLIHGYHSAGGAFIVNKDKYMRAGGENENICGWKLEEAERLKRMEILSLPVCYSKGPLFQLWHPKGNISQSINNENEIRNRKEFLKTCSITHYR